MRRSEAADRKDTGKGLTTFALPVAGGDVRGGDLANSLSAREIDGVLGDKLALPCDTFFLLERGEITSDDVRRRVRLALDAGTPLEPRVWFIIHVRQHWVLAEASRTSLSGHTLTIFDSARSPCVQRDIYKMAVALGWPRPLFPAVNQQQRGSLQCGIFAIAFCLLRSGGFDFVDRFGKVDLHDIRSLLLNWDGSHVDLLQSRILACARCVLEGRAASGTCNAGAVWASSDVALPTQTPVALPTSPTSDRRTAGPHLDPCAKPFVLRWSHNPYATSLDGSPTAGARPQRPHLKFCCACRLSRPEDEFVEIGGECRVCRSASVKRAAPLEKTLPTAILRSVSGMCTIQSTESVPANLASLREAARQSHEHAQKLERRSAAANLCFMLTATAIDIVVHFVRPGEHHDLSVKTLAAKALELGFIQREGGKFDQVDVCDALQRLGLQVVFPTRSNGTSETEKVQALAEHAAYCLAQKIDMHPRASSSQRDVRDLQPELADAFFVLKVNPPATVPAVFRGAHFLLGARFDGRITPEGSRNGHYTTTLTPDRATAGLYWKSSEASLELHGRSISHKVHSTAQDEAPAVVGPPPYVCVDCHRSIPVNVESQRENIVRTHVDSNWHRQHSRREIVLPEPAQDVEGRRCTARNTTKKGVVDQCGAPAVEGFTLCPHHLYTIGTTDCKTLNNAGARCKALAVVRNSFCPMHLVAEAVRQRRRAPAPDQLLCEAPLLERLLPVETEPPVQPFPALASVDVVSHGAVRAFLRRQHHGSTIKMSWLSCPGDTNAGVAGTVIGRLDMSKPGYAVVIFLREWCAGCGLWARPEDDCVDLPLSGMIYTELHAFPVEKIPRVACSCSAEVMELVDSSVLDAPSDAVRASDPFRTELASDASLGFLTQSPTPASVASPLGLRGSVGRRWYIFTKRPPHVHSLTWNAAATSTRAAHVRWLEVIKGMPHDLEAAPLGPALIECVLRMARARGWGWPTISSSLSSIASALLRLPLYTNVSSGINLKLDTAFATASRRAQHLARISLRNRERQALSKVRYSVLLQNLKDPIPRLFLALAWRFAARIGDLRQVEAADVSCTKSCSKTSAKHEVKLTFRYGKGAAWWGPFTLHAICDAATVKALQDHISARPEGPLFTFAEQRVLSALMKDEHLTLRAIRRGSLQHLASCGVSDDQIQILSGHRRRETLLRYLGWGRWSATSTAAAIARDARETLKEAEEEERDSDDCISDEGCEDDAVEGGAEPIQGEAVTVEAPKMGPHSGYCGNHGKKISPPPPFLPNKPPKHKDLGIPPDSTSTKWPLHAKNLPDVSWSTIRRELGGEVLEQLSDGHTTKWDSVIDAASSMLESDRHYGTPQRLYGEGEIPISHFSEQDVKTMYGVGKVEPHLGPIRGFVVGHVVFQIPKKRRRPVMRPSINDTARIPDELEVHYPARRERRAKARNRRYNIDFDMSGYFDQFGISPHLRNYFVMRVRNDDGSTALWRLTKMPMGATFAPAVAQSVTWALLAQLKPLVSSGALTIDTMIDNVRLCSGDSVTFLFAVKSFLARCRKCGIVINEPELPPTFTGSLSSTDWHELEDKELLMLGELREKTFLGELYLPGDQVANSTKNVTKLQTAWNLLLEYASHVCGKGSAEGKSQHAPSNPLSEGENLPRTVRHVCSLIGLAMWMASTLDLHIANYQALVRSYSRLASFGALGGTDKSTGWDQPLGYVAPSLLHNLRGLVTVLLINHPVPLPVMSPRPSVEASAYDLVIYIDACQFGWGALVTFTPPGRLNPITICVRQGWSMSIKASACAEPRAVRRLYEWIHTNLTQHVATTAPIRAALISDHSALPTGQRRWHSHHGGFSSSFDLNDAFRAINTDWIQSEIFAVAGEENPADGPSRDPTNGPSIQATETSLLATESFADLWHPYRLFQRKWWQW